MQFSSVAEAPLVEWVEDYPRDEVTDVVRIGTILRTLILERKGLWIECLSPSKIHTLKPLPQCDGK